MGKSLGILLKTSPYLVMRTLAYLAFTLVTIVYFAVILGLVYLAATGIGGDAGGIVALILVLGGIGGFIGISKLAERMVFYAIKAGHVAVITELLTKGELPAGVNQVQFGKDVVVKHFGTMAAFFAVDMLVEGAVNQVLGWLTMAANFLDFIPGLRTIWSVVRSVLSVVGNYIDEAVLSYTLCHPGQSVWKSGADGVVLYAQAWKKLIVTAVIVVVVITIIWLIAAVPFFFAGWAIGSAVLPADAQEMAWVVGLIAGAIAGGIVRSIVADPLSMVMVVTAYHDAIREMTPSVDLYAKLQGVSKKFKELVGRSEQPAPVPAR